MPTSTDSGKDRAILEEDEVRVVVAERMLGLEVQRDLVADVVAEQRFLDLRQQVLAADQELDRIGQLVDRLALRIAQPPDQADDAGRGDRHRSMIAQSFMDIDRSTPLLGGLSAREFMRRHWQKKPLLIRCCEAGRERRS